MRTSIKYSSLASVLGVVLMVAGCQQQTAETDAGAPEVAAQAQAQADSPIISAEAIEMLVKSPWPGNIRELYNVVEQAVALASTPIITPALVESAIRGRTSELASFESARSEFEREYLAKILRITAGNVTKAAKLAKRNRTEFYKLLQRHHLDPKLFKAL